MRFSQLRLKTCKECGCGRWPQPHLFVFLGLENKIIFLLGQKMVLGVRAKRGLGGKSSRILHLICLDFKSLETFEV
jgi:hypothetical protein